MSTTNQCLNLAGDCNELFAGKIDDDVLRRTVASLERFDDAEEVEATAKVAAKGNITSMIFYTKVECYIDGGKNFSGDAGSVGLPGAGALFGDVYLSSASTLNELYEKTVSFAFTATPVYTAVYFFDSDSNLLAHFQAGAVSVVTGTGGGSGSWS